MQRQDCCKFEASLGYILSSRLAKVRMKGPVSLPTHEVGENLINMHPEFYFKVNFIWDFSTAESTAVGKGACG